MKKWLFFLISFLLPMGCAHATENLFYLASSSTDTAMNLTHFDEIMQTLPAHASQINILAPQAYQMDQYGLVSGEVNSQLIDFAHTHSIQLLPLVTNQGFSHTQVDALLHSPTAEKTGIQFLVNTCLAEGFAGIQFDFESVPFADRDLLTDFYAQAAKALHQHHLLMSIALPAQLSDAAYSSGLQLYWAEKNGAYDQKKLGEIADFVTIMAYDQHTSFTTPGPIASLPWVKQIIQYALQNIPSHKISLGVPAYSDYWKSSLKSQPDGSLKAQPIFQQINYVTAMALIQNNQASLSWDPVNQVNYAVYQADNLNEYVFIANAASLAAEQTLVKQYHLRGISVWRLGTEDPKIWSALAP